MSRTGQQRLDSIPAAVERRDEFRGRVVAAEGDAVRCADLMAEAISMQIEANHMETVGHNGKVTVSVEDVMAGHCMIDARDAYLRARGSNQP
jgi:histone H3/H4